MISSPNESDIRVDLITAPALLKEAFHIRHLVFVEEQGVPAEDELDEYESQSRHFLAYLNGKPCGTARWRYTPEGKIKLERFAVLQGARGKGIGIALVKAVLKSLPKGEGAYLHAQVQVISFYENLGFEAKGDEFDECGIIHRKMYWSPALPAVE